MGGLLSGGRGRPCRARPGHRLMSRRALRRASEAAVPTPHAALAVGFGGRTAGGYPNLLNFVLYNRIKNIANVEVVIKIPICIIKNS